MLLKLTQLLFGLYLIIMQFRVAASTTKSPPYLSNILPNNIFINDTYIFIFWSVLSVKVSFLFFSTINNTRDQKVLKLFHLSWLLLIFHQKIFLIP